MHLIVSLCLCGCYFGRLLGTKQPPEKEKGEETEEVEGKGGLPDEYMYFHHTFEKPASRRRT